MGRLADDDVSELCRLPNPIPPDHLSHYKTPVYSVFLSSEVTFESGTDKDFRNVEVIQRKPHTVNPETKKCYL